MGLRIPLRHRTRIGHQSNWVYKPDTEDIGTVSGVGEGPHHVPSRDGTRLSRGRDHTPARTGDELIHVQNHRVSPPTSNDLRVPSAPKPHIASHSNIWERDGAPDRPSPTDVLRPPPELH